MSLNQNSYLYAYVYTCRFNEVFVDREITLDI